MLRAGFPDEVWVRGEIRDLSRAASGHVYFTLVEERDDGSRACVDVMLSARNKPGVNRSLTAAGGAVRMTDGTEVRVRGRVDWFAPAASCSCGCPPSTPPTPWVSSRSLGRSC